MMPIEDVAKILKCNNIIGHTANDSLALTMVEKLEMFNINTPCIEYKNKRNRYDKYEPILVYCGNNLQNCLYSGSSTKHNSFCCYLYELITH